MFHNHRLDDCTSSRQVSNLQMTFLFFYLLVVLLPSLASADEVVIFGRTHTSIGAATLAVVEEKLVVSNMGPSGEDGVAIDVAGELLGQALEFEFDDPGDLPAEAFLDFASQGTVDGMEDQPVGSLRGEHSEVTMDLNGLTPSSVTAYYFASGDLIGTEEGLETQGVWRFHDDEPWWKKLLSFDRNPQGIA